MLYEPAYDLDNVRGLLHYYSRSSLKKNCHRQKGPVHVTHKDQFRDSPISLENGCPLYRTRPPSPDSWNGNCGNLKSARFPIFRVLNFGPKRIGLTRGIPPAFRDGVHLTLFMPVNRHLIRAEFIVSRNCVPMAFIAESPPAQG